MTLRIKEIAKEKGLKLYEVAERLEMEPESFSRIINGNPTVSTLQKIAAVLNVSITDLFVEDPARTTDHAFKKIIEIANNQLSK